MKLCSSSHKYKNIILIILNDDKYKFCKNLPSNLQGQIDKMFFLNFCISSNSIKIIKTIIKNTQLLDTIEINIMTLILLLKNSIFTTKEKTYIYNKIIKTKLEISSEKLFSLLLKYDIKCLFWLKKKKLIIKDKDIKLLFKNEINDYALSFCRKKKIVFIPTLIKMNKYQIISFEDYANVFNDKELILLINEGLKSMHKSGLDINLLDSIIILLKKYQYLIDKIDIQLLNKKFIQEKEIFNFLNIDIEKILLYRKLGKVLMPKMNHIVNKI